MIERPYLPPPEAFPHLPLSYFDLHIEDRARALQIAGREIADEVFESFFAEARTSGSEGERNTQ